jgi:hypothetical protein
MGNDAGERDTLSSGKRGFRAMLAATKAQTEQHDTDDSDQSVSKTCPKKANPDLLWSGL